MTYNPENDRYVKRKLNVENKTWHLEFMYDQPLFKDFTFDGKKVQKAIFGFKDLDDDVEFTTMMSATTKVCSKLLDHRAGDQIDLTYKAGSNKMGLPIHFYDILPLNTTPNTGGPQYERKEDNVVIGDANSNDDSLSSIEF